MTLRRLRKLYEVVTLDEVLFGADVAPTPEMVETRRDLIARFRAVMAEFNEENAGRLWDYLVAEQKGYDALVSGRSPIMCIVEEIREHQRAEKARRDRLVVTGLDTFETDQ
jgi:ribosome modulation factor